MILYIPYGFTPYEGSLNYGVFSTKEKAEKVLIEQRKHRDYEDYGVIVLELDDEESF